MTVVLRRRGATAVTKIRGAMEAAAGSGSDGSPTASAKGGARSSPRGGAISRQIALETREHTVDGYRLKVPSAGKGGGGGGPSGRQPRGVSACHMRRRMPSLLWRALLRRRLLL